MTRSGSICLLVRAAHSSNGARQVATSAAWCAGVCTFELDNMWFCPSFSHRSRTGTPPLHLPGALVACLNGRVPTMTRSSPLTSVALTFCISDVGAFRMAISRSAWPRGRVVRSTPGMATWWPYAAASPSRSSDWDRNIVITRVGLIVVTEIGSWPPGRDPLVMPIGQDCPAGGPSAIGRMIRA